MWCIVSSRSVCNVPHFKPEDIIRKLYGYACGDNFAERSCLETGGADTGVCRYGPKNRVYAADLFRVAARDSVVNFAPFVTWMMSTLNLAQTLHIVCAAYPISERTCVDLSEDTIFNASLANVNNMLAEVSDNMQSAIDCFCPCKRLQLVALTVPDDEPGASFAEVLSIQINGVETINPIDRNGDGEFVVPDAFKVDLTTFNMLPSYTRSDGKLQLYVKERDAAILNTDDEYSGEFDANLEQGQPSDDSEWEYYYTCIKENETLISGQVVQIDSDGNAYYEIEPQIFYIGNAAFDTGYVFHIRVYDAPEENCAP